MTYPMRFCLGGCGAKVPSGRCAACRSRMERRRGSPTTRGYGAAHRANRQALAATLPRPCGYGCGTMLTRSSKWIAAHVVDGRPEYGYLVSCPLCNERAKRRPDPIMRPGR